jgi:hypothetical protein
MHISVAHRAMIGFETFDSGGETRQVFSDVQNVDYRQNINLMKNRTFTRHLLPN